MQAAHERKMLKYHHLWHTRKENHPETYLFALEIGARGSLQDSASKLDMLFCEETKLAKECRQHLVTRAFRGSFTIYQNRDRANWNPMDVCISDE